MEAHLLAEREWIREDPNRLVRGGYLKIKSKAEAVVPLNLSYTQKRFLDLNQRLYDEGRPRRIIAAKARQTYCTTITQAVMFADTSQKEGRNTFIISDCDDGSNYIYNMSRLFYISLKQNFPHLTPKTSRNNSEGITFSELYSDISLTTARNPNAGRKMTLHNVHLSEFAFFEHPRVLMRGIMQSVPDSKESLVVIESTSNGKGGYYYNEVMKAKNHETDWELYFVAWFECPDYNRTVTKEQIEFMQKTLTAEEDALINIYNVKWGQLWWRRWCIINNCGGLDKCKDRDFYHPNEEDKNAMDTLHQEYPAYVEQSFIASGNCRFETSVLEKWQNSAPVLKTDKNAALIPGKNYITGYFFLTEDGFLDFVEQTNGPWKLFEYPEQGVDYAMGADVAEGIECEDGSGDFDYSTAFFIRRDTLAQVAEYRAYIEPDLFALECFMGLMYYNTPMAGVEANKDGQTVLKFLREVYGYSNIFVRKVTEQEKQRERTTKKLGWLTTGGKHKGSRHTMINEMAEFIRNEEGIFRSQDLLSECFTFVKFPDGRVEHGTGCHDDLVFAAGIALQMHMLTPLTEAWTKRARMKLDYAVPSYSSNIKRPRMKMR